MTVITNSRFLRGWVRFEGLGSAEQLLYRTAQAGIPLWNTKSCSGKVFSCCYADDYKRLRGAMRHSGIRLRLKQRYGVPFLVRRCQGRYGLLCGSILAAALLWYLPQHIWLITVTGNTTVCTEDITAAVAELGVETGQRFDSLDMDTIRIKTLSTLPDIAWLTVNPDGCIARIEVTEREPIDNPDTDNTPSNIVATCDGVIRSIKATGGHAAKRVGEAVAAGDLLVSGVYEDISGFTSVSRSKAEVLALTEHTLMVEIPFYERQWLPEGDTSFRPVFQFLNLSVPLYTSAPLNGDVALTETDRRLKLWGLTLPIGRIDRTYTDYCWVDVERTEEQARLLAMEKLKELFTKTYPRASVLSQEITEDVTGNTLKLTAVYQCEEDIAREIPLVILPNK